MSAPEPQAAAQAARSRSNLAFALVSLEPQRRDAMGFFYDFCRLVDDIADEPERSIPQKYGELLGWQDAVLSWTELRAETAPAPNIFPPETRSIPPERGLANTLREICARYQVRTQDLLDIIGGVQQDVEPRLFANFEELRRYCYGVASAVGMVSIRIFGCVEPRSEAFAEALGYALQFTNILRDIREDLLEKKRVYLPQDEMAFFKVTPDTLLSDKPHAGRDRLLRLQYFRAKHFFNRARRILPPKDKDALKAALVMGAIYEEILETIRRKNFPVKKRVSLSKPRKIFLLWRTVRALKKPWPDLHPPGTAAVFGAGVAGMAAAVWLGLEGFDVDCVEAKKIPGGRACSLRERDGALVLDNAQHIAMGCYHNFLDLAELLGVTTKLRKKPVLDVTYVDKGGARAHLRAKNWPLGLGMLYALWKFEKLARKDRWAIVRLALTLRMGGQARPGETAAQWLARHGQTPASLYALWRPFCVAALNQEPETADAALLRETLRRSLLGGARDAAIYFANVPLGELFYPEAERFLRSIGSGIRLGEQVSGLSFEDERCTGYFLNGETEKRSADVTVCALNPQGLKNLLPADSPVAQKLGALGHNGILSVHVFCDQKLFAEHFVGFLDSPVHWVFDRRDLLPESERDERFLYAVTLSAPGALMEASRDEILELLRAEFAAHFPQSAGVKFLQAIVVKSRDATFAAVPGAEALRPDTRAVSGLLLCGDYTATGLPSTLESAADSAHRAVDALNHA